MIQRISRRHSRRSRESSNEAGKTPRFDLVELIRRHDANAVITPSASRNLIYKGQIDGVRNFLRKLPIERIAKPVRFSRALDRATQRLATKHFQRRRLRGGWGAARKFLNLYLRRITYKLSRIESLLELPMDRYAAKGLEKRYKGTILLPSWDGISKLNSSANALYQAAAQELAEGWMTKRVHLDMKFWRDDSH